jgi:predicted transcriptional regulator of viral defense system
MLAEMVKKGCFSSIMISQVEKAMAGDLERTIVDIASKPMLCGIIEVGNAIFQGKDRTDHDKLLYYFVKNMKKSAKKMRQFGMKIHVDPSQLMLIPANSC